LLLASCLFLAWLTLQHWRWRWNVCWLTFSRLHGVLSQKVGLFVWEEDQSFVS
jgi:hypothetical protein